MQTVLPKFRFDYPLIGFGEQLNLFNSVKGLVLLVWKCHMLGEYKIVLMINLFNPLDYINNI